MIKVGVTGGIGSGRGTVCGIFKAFDVPVFDSDSIAKNQYQKQEVIQKVIDLLGNDILTNGELDKNKLAKIVFSDEEKLNQVSELIQPYVMQEYEIFCDQHKHRPYCIFESAILFERKLDALFDKIITVTAEKETRIERVMKRSAMTREQVIDRMNSQVDDNVKIRNSDFVLLNYMSEKELERDVHHIHKKLIQ